MSKSRVKRTYDNFCGEEAMMVSSPQCSPMRITSLTGSNNDHQHQPQHHTQQQQHDGFALEPAMASSSAASSSGSFHGFSALNPHPIVTFTSLQPAAASSSTPAHTHTHTHTHTAPPSYFSSPAPSSKRTRKTGASDVSMAMDEEEAAAAATQNKHESPFQKLKRPHLDDLMFVPRAFKKQAIAAALSGPSSSSHATPVCAPVVGGMSNLIPPPASTTGTALPNYHHQLFTYDQVASIVRNAVEMREEQIREEYNRTLQDLLREQFENFSSFNRDYISRNMKARDTAEDDEDYENSYYS